MSKHQSCRECRRDFVGPDCNIGSNLCAGCEVEQPQDGDEITTLHRQLTQAQAALAAKEGENSRLTTVELEWLAERKAITTALEIELEGIPKGKACAGLDPILKAIAALRAERDLWKTTVDCDVVVLQGVLDILGNGTGDPELLAQKCVDERDKLLEAVEKLRVLLHRVDIRTDFGRKDPTHGKDSLWEEVKRAIVVPLAATALAAVRAMEGEK